MHFILWYSIAGPEWEFKDIVHVCSSADLFLKKKKTFKISGYQQSINFFIQQTTTEVLLYAQN